MNMPGFRAEDSLNREVIKFQHRAIGTKNTDSSVVVAQRINLPPVPGCGACTPLTWPDGTSTGACARACCDVLGRCYTETCPCGGGGLSVGSWGGVFGRLA